MSETDYRAILRLPIILLNADLSVGNVFLHFIWFQRALNSKGSNPGVISFLLVYLQNIPDIPAILLQFLRSMFLNWGHVKRIEPRGG